METLAIVGLALVGLTVLTNNVRAAKGLLERENAQRCEGWTGICPHEYGRDEWSWVTRSEWRHR